MLAKRTLQTQSCSKAGKCLCAMGSASLCSIPTPLPPASKLAGASRGGQNLCPAIPPVRFGGEREGSVFTSLKTELLIVTSSFLEGGNHSCLSPPAGQEIPLLAEPELALNHCAEADKDSQTLALRTVTTLERGLCPGLVPRTPPPPSHSGALDSSTPEEARQVALSKRFSRKILGRCHLPSDCSISLTLFQDEPMPHSFSHPL